MADDLDTTTRALLACVCDALADEGRPTCQCYATVGDPVIGLCCSCEGDGYSADAPTGEVTVHLEQIYDVDPATLQQVTPIRPCRKTTTAADITLVVTRCYPTVDEFGNMPDPDAADAAATLLHDDVTTVWNALTCGCFDGRMIVTQVAVGAPPEGGCAVLIARVTVEVKL